MWKIVDLEYRLNDGIVIKLTAEYRLTNDDIIARKIFSIDLPEPTNEVIPFENLAEEQVLTWLHSFFDTKKNEDIVQVELDRLVKVKNDKKTDNKLPWIDIV